MVSSKYNGRRRPGDPDVQPVRERACPRAGHCARLVRSRCRRPSQHDDERGSERLLPNEWLSGPALARDAPRYSCDDVHTRFLLGSSRWRLPRFFARALRTLLTCQFSLGDSVPFESLLPSDSRCFEGLLRRTLCCGLPARQRSRPNARYTVTHAILLVILVEQPSALSSNRRET